MGCSVLAPALASGPRRVAPRCAERTRLPTAIHLDLTSAIRKSGRTFTARYWSLSTAICWALFVGRHLGNGAPSEFNKLVKRRFKQALHVAVRPVFDRILLSLPGGLLVSIWINARWCWRISAFCLSHSMAGIWAAATPAKRTTRASLRMNVLLDRRHFITYGIGSPSSARQTRCVAPPFA